MKILFSIVLLVLLISCQESATPPSKKVSNHIEQSKVNKDSIVIPKPEDFGITLKPESNKSYQETKSTINNLRLATAAEKEFSEKAISSVFTQKLVNEIIPYWYGTKWSFEGHTKHPQKGEIACGYFVSTTLKDVGININRYKLAQQAPLFEAKTIALDQALIEINESTVEKNIQAILQLTTAGIYFIGFDQSHVGYLLRKKDQLFLIHSNYINAEGVIIEVIENSEVFSFFQKFYLAPISTNKTLLEKWLNQEEIKVIKN